jgi:type IV secretory pathway VirB9-like protein
MAMLMNMRFSLLLTAALLPSIALAEAPPPGISVVPKMDTHEPIPGKQDPRIRTFPYDPANTMRLTTPGLNPVRVVFADGSIPTTIAGALVSRGGTQQNQSPPTDWFATDAGNTMLLQPLHDNMPISLLFVTTRLEGEQSNYVIELHVGTGDITNPNDASAYAQVAYTYPKTSDPKAQKDRIAEGKIQTSLTQARFSAPRQWHYSKQGADCATLTPSNRNWISDDGSQTSMLFPPHMTIGTVWSRQSDDDKDESMITPIPTTTRVGTLLVLPGVYKQIVLRLGVQSCAVRNDDYDGVGSQPGGGSGTISPDVIRTVRATRR